MAIKAVRLKTEYTENPIGLDTDNPRLSWILESEERSQKQSAYHVLVASTEEALRKGQGDIWDSGKVTSDRSVHVRYEGKRLDSGARCYWKVKVWDKSGQPSEWSDSAFWTMGLLDPAEWKASWIGGHAPEGQELLPPAFLRKEIRLDKPVKRATAYASALGLFMLYVNGRRVSDDYFSPGWTDYPTRVQYQTFDVTDLLVSGANALGAVLATGWYAGHVGMMGNRYYGNQPYFLMQVVVEFQDGTTQEVLTDTTWKTANGPMRYSDMIMGETYDARLEMDGWDEPGFEDVSWSEPARLESYKGKMVARIDPPIRVTGEMRPVSVTQTESGGYIFDMGQNMVGWARLDVNGEKGTAVTLSYAEMLNPDGSLHTKSLRKATPRDTYICKGQGEESYEPHFTYHGFRYVELIGYPGTPTLDTIVGKVVHSDTPPTGRFETSDAMINRLHSNITWGQRGNFVGVPTDCPQRDERLGWTGDAQIFIRTASFNMNVARFFEKYAVDMEDAQHPLGAFPDVAPDGGYYERYRKLNKWTDVTVRDNAGWSDAGVIIPWVVYQVYGDTEIIEQSYTAMTKFMEFLQKSSEAGLRPGTSRYGDWLSIDAVTPKEVLATAYYAYCADLMSRMAGVIGRREDAEHYRELAGKIKQAFVEAYVDEEGRVQGDSQTGYVLALHMRLLPEQLERLAVKHLTDDIRKRGNRLSTGFLGVGYLLLALSDYGQDETAYALLHQEQFPSWLYPIKQGATTVWERWDAWTIDNGFHPSGMNSFNHYALGSVGEWMHRYMAGIDTDSAQPGYKHILIKPRPGGKITYANGEFESVHGKIVSSWRLEGDKFRLRVEIPANTTATVYVPYSDAKSDADGTGHVEVAGRQQGSAVFRIGSGSYEFVSMR